MVHYEIDPIKAFVHESVLYDEDLSKDNMIPCEIFCISSYINEAITFGIKLFNGSLFFYIPPHKISLNKNISDLSLLDLVYNNNESDIITIKKFKNFNTVFVYFKNKNIWLEGKYFYTLDWYEGNDLRHMILLENGQFCFMPSHKIKFDKDKLNFENYLKIHSEWKV